MSATLTTKGQVTIPQHIREALNLVSCCRADFGVNGDGELVLRKASARTRRKRDRFEAARGKAEIKWRTDSLFCHSAREISLFSAAVESRISPGSSSVSDNANWLISSLKLSTRICVASLQGWPARAVLLTCLTISGKSVAAWVTHQAPAASLIISSMNSGRPQ